MLSKQAVAAARDYAEGIVETVRVPLLVLDGDLRVESANCSFYREFGVEPSETIGTFIYDLGNHQWNILRLRELLEEILPMSTSIEAFQVEHDFERLGRRVMLLNARRILDPLRKTTQILLAIEDIKELWEIGLFRDQAANESVFQELQSRGFVRYDHLPFKSKRDGAVETARPLILEKGHQLTVSLPPEPIWLDADVSRMEQVLVNLLTNAAKYTGEGGRIWVTVKQEGQECVFRVRDNGVGIPRDLLPHVFDLFTQSERSLDRSQGGLGIGLALVQRLTNLHGGTAEVYSEVGQDVRTAHDGMMAVQTAIEYKPDVVLLVIGLPTLNGYEVAKRIRQESTLKNVVLIALTGYGQDSDRQRALQAGFNHHLVKPARLEQLQQILATVPIPL